MEPILPDRPPNETPNTNSNLYINFIFKSQGFWGFGVLGFFST